ncbi:MAG: radical SAM protein [Acidilobaceae archaeon]
MGLGYSGGVLKPARLWENVNGRAMCLVCERRCLIPPGGRGVCGSYVNIDGTLYHLGYGRLSAVESRPIEIKPLFHYWPNSTALTFSTWGRNFYCPWCQNHHLSFRKPRDSDPVVEPGELLRLAESYGDEGFSASFNEPTVNFDYIVDLACDAVRRGFYFMMVTNGYLSGRALRELLEVGVDGWSVDIKGCPGMRRALASVDHNIIYRNAKTILDYGGHVEMVYLMVTNTNDFEECVDWIIKMHLDKLGPQVPLHINKYYPANYWREPPTNTGKLVKAAEKARREGVEHVYIGNINNPDFETTRCPKCGKTLIRREYYRVTGFLLEKTGDSWRCPRCGYKIMLRGLYITGKSWSARLL